MLVRQALVEARFRTQAELAAWLKGLGYAVSQPSISRDLREIGGRKLGGRYRLAPDPLNSAAGLSGLVESFGPAGPHLVVVRTLPGGAQRVAHAIDQSNWPEAAGTVAGDDTIFVAAVSAGGQQAILERLRNGLAAQNGVAE